MSDLEKLQRETEKREPSPEIQAIIDKTIREMEAVFARKKR